MDKVIEKLVENVLWSPVTGQIFALIGKAKPPMNSTEMPDVVFTMEESRAVQIYLEYRKLMMQLWVITKNQQLTPTIVSRQCDVWFRMYALIQEIIGTADHIDSALRKCITVAGSYGNNAGLGSLVAYVGDLALATWITQQCIILREAPATAIQPMLPNMIAPHTNVYRQLQAPPAAASAAAIVAATGAVTNIAAAATVIPIKKPRKPRMKKAKMMQTGGEESPINAQPMTIMGLPEPIQVPTSAPVPAPSVPTPKPGKRLTSALLNESAKSVSTLKSGVPKEPIPETEAPRNKHSRHTSKLVKKNQALHDLIDKKGTPSSVLNTITISNPKSKSKYPHVSKHESKRKHAKETDSENSSVEEEEEEEGGEEYKDNDSEDDDEDEEEECAELSQDDKLVVVGPAVTKTVGANGWTYIPSKPTATSVAPSTSTPTTTAPPPPAPESIAVGITPPSKKSTPIAPQQFNPEEVNTPESSEAEESDDVDD